MHALIAAQLHPVWRRPVDHEALHRSELVAQRRAHRQGRRALLRRPG
jgi:hypothetical protein